MQFITLTRNKIAVVDDDDYEYLSQFKWHTLFASNNWYAVGRMNKKDKIYMHRIIMNAKEGEEVDHIDGSGLNNQKSNLRICNRRQNARNMKNLKNGSSEYKGVSWGKRDKKWYSQIMVDGKRIHLGSYTEEVEAAAKYNEAAVKYFGEFARLNILCE